VEAAIPEVTHTKEIFRSRCPHPWEQMPCGEFVAGPFTGLDFAQDLDRLMRRNEMRLFVQLQHQADQAKGAPCAVDAPGSESRKGSRYHCR